VLWRGVREMACDQQEEKGPGRGWGFPGEDRDGLVAEWGLAMLYPLKRW
jgi:hypothetical protein